MTCCKPVPSGDAYFGTWIQTSTVTTLTIIVASETFGETTQISSSEDTGRLVLKLDGTESKIADGFLVAQEKRINGQTIEILRQAANDNAFREKSQYQMKRSLLSITSTTDIPDRSPSTSVSYYERIP